MQTIRLELVKWNEIIKFYQFQTKSLRLPDKGKVCSVYWSVDPKFFTLYLCLVLSDPFSYSAYTFWKEQLYLNKKKHLEKNKCIHFRGFGVD